MKILRFLLIILFYFIISIQNTIADEAKMLKGLEIFNETAACAGCHTMKAAGAEGNVGPNLDTVAGLTVESETKAAEQSLLTLNNFFKN